MRASTERHEVGDLQDMLRDAWKLMSQEQRQVMWPLLVKD
jgi:hypothetical protein